MILLDNDSSSALPGKGSVTLPSRASRPFATTAAGAPSPSSDTNPAQYHFPALVLTGSTLKLIASSGGAGSELGLGSLTNFMNGSPTYSAGVFTALRLCLYAGTRASTFFKNIDCVAASRGSGPKAICFSLINCVMTSSDPSDEGP